MRDIISHDINWHWYTNGTIVPRYQRGAVMVL